MNESNLTDEAIALRIGYEDKNYFRKIFERFEGMTTEEYRLIKNKPGILSLLVLLIIYQ